MIMTKACLRHTSILTSKSMENQPANGTDIKQSQQILKQSGTK